MAASRAGRGSGQDRNFTDRDAAHGLAPDPSRVMVVGNSQINLVVVSKIVERSALKPVCESPATAVRTLPLMFPGLVILDGGPEDRDCDGLIAGIEALRRVSGRKLPAVILLSSRSGAAMASVGAIVDAVVTKPFTTEQLQPVIDRLARHARR